MNDDFDDMDFIAYLGRLVYTEEGYRLFLHTASSRLDGLKPIEAIDQGRTQDVIAILAEQYDASII